MITLKQVCPICRTELIKTTDLDSLRESTLSPLSEHLKTHHKETGISGFFETRTISIGKIADIIDLDELVKS